MRLCRLDLAVLQRNVIITHRIRSAAASDLDDAPFQRVVVQRTLGVHGNGILRQGHGLAGVHRQVGEAGGDDDVGGRADVAHLLVDMHSPGAVGLRGVAAVLRRQCARSHGIAPDGDAGDRAAGGHRIGGGGHGERSGCTVLGLEGKTRPCRSTDGVRLGGEGHALALFDVNDVPASVEAVFPAVCVRQDDAVEHGDIIQQHAVAADLGAGLVGVGVLVAGEDVIGAALVQAVHRGGGDRRAAGGPPVAGGGGAGGVDVLLIGLEVADLKRRVGPVGVLLCRNVRQRRGVVVGGLADLRRCADDLAEIAILRDDDADADVLAHVSRTGDILAIGRVGNILPCAAAVRAALPLELALPDVDARGYGAGEEDGLTENGAVYVARLAREGLDLRRFADHQLNDMLVADDADEAAVLLQIQLQIIGIDLGVCALRNGDRMRGFIGIDGLCLLYCGRTGNIMLALGSIGIARVLQLLRQRLPLEGEGMRLAVVHPLNGALPVLEVVDGLAVQLDIDNAPCVADDLDGSVRVEFQIEIIIIFPHERRNVLGGIELSVYLYRAVREALHGVKYHFQLGTRCGIRIHPIAIAICGNIVNVEFGILVGRVEHAALEQQHRDGSHIKYSVFSGYVNMKAVVEVCPVYDYLRCILLHTFHHERRVEHAAVEDNARLCFALSLRQLIRPDNAVEGTAVDREIGIEQLQRQRHCFNREAEERLAPVPVVCAVDRAAVDRDLRALAVLWLIKIVVADAAAGSIAVRHVRIQLGQRAAVHCEF